MTKKTQSKTITVVQTGSTTKIGDSMIGTLKGLGLGKPRTRRVVEDTAAVRGMIHKVRHLVTVEE